ncbi:unnamed protein product [Clavelina lepadiformis]|uniref:Uncharacterized protein n=1 Tax=Clavelina lepadiformis TaxID=159417 RepID=A0ABP0H1M1_CLALP
MQLRTKWDHERNGSGWELYGKEWKRMKGIKTGPNCRISQEHVRDFFYKMALHTRANQCLRKKETLTFVPIYGAKLLFKTDMFKKRKQETPIFPRFLPYGAAPCLHQRWTVSALMQVLLSFRVSHVLYRHHFYCGVP